MKKQPHNRVNFQYDGKTSKYDLGRLQELLPFHGALSALFRVILDDVIDAAIKSGNPTKYITALISRRASWIEEKENGKSQEFEEVHS